MLRSQGPLLHPTCSDILMLASKMSGFCDAAAVGKFMTSALQNLQATEDSSSDQNKC